MKQNLLNPRKNVWKPINQILTDWNSIEFMLNGWVESLLSLIGIHSFYTYFGVSHLGFWHLGFGHFGFGHLGFDHLGFSHFGFSHLGFSHLGFGHLGFSQLGFSHLGFSHMRFSHLGFSHLGFVHNGFNQNVNIANEPQDIKPKLGIKMTADQEIKGEVK